LSSEKDSDLYPLLSNSFQVIDGTRWFMLDAKEAIPDKKSVSNAVKLKTTDSETAK